MNCKIAKNVSIVETLNKLGFAPVKIIGNDFWYNSPFRIEKKPSFKVSSKLNRWFDHGIGEGGNIIDLIQKMKKITTSEALDIIENIHGSFSFHQQAFYKNIKPLNNYEITKIKRLENPILIDYLTLRKINIDVAKKYCKEVYYTINQKKYFAIAFKNNSNGMETRNKYFKGCLGMKDISIIKNSSKTVLIFEGFLDFLSFKSSHLNDNEQSDYIILNSVSLVNKLTDLLNNYINIHSYLDNDNSGRQAFIRIKTIHKKAIDMSVNYKNFKDVNEWLMKNKCMSS